MSTEQHIGPSAIVTKAGVGVDGPGYLGGEAPEGRTTVGGVPVSADVDVFYELDTKDWQHVASTTSQPDGTWSIVGLNPDKKFNVVARHASFGGVIAVDVQPSRTDVVTLSGAFTANDGFNGVAGFMTVESGMPPFAASVVDPLPYGLTPLVVDGRKLVIDGTSNDVGLWESVVRVTDSNSLFADVPVEVEIKEQTPRFWRITMTEDVWPFGSYGKGLQIAELQFNGVRATGGTPMASSSYEGPPSFGLSCAFDGDSSGNSVWAAVFPTTAVGQWLGYEFAAPTIVNSVKITVRNHYNVSMDWSPKSFDVQSSTDGATWKTEWSVTGQGSWSAAETRTFYR